MSEEPGADELLEQDSSTPQQDDAEMDRANPSMLASQAQAGEDPSPMSSQEIRQAWGEEEHREPVAEPIHEYELYQGADRDPFPWDDIIIKVLAIALIGGTIAGGVYIYREHYSTKPSQFKETDNGVCLSVVEFETPIPAPSLEIFGHNDQAQRQHELDRQQERRAIHTRMRQRLPSDLLQRLDPDHDRG